MRRRCPATARVRRCRGIRAVTAAIVVGGSLLAVAAPAPPAAASVPAAPYVALGDSYTAGPWIPKQLPDPAGCQRSDHNYPHVVAPALGLGLRDVSCSGAGTTHMTRPQDVSRGPNPPQLDALGAETRVVTLGIGGNDIGFGSLVTTCVVVVPWGTPCQDRYVVNGVDEISRRIAETAPRIATVLDDIHRRSPSATVFVVGYPTILPDAGFGCWPVLPFAPSDVPWLRAKHRELNAMLAAQAAADGSVYVDVYTPSIGHDACALPLHRWVEPVVPLSPAAPVHPNARGMEGMAAEVAARVRAASPVGA